MAVFADTDTYILGGWVLMSVGIGVLAGEVFTLPIGIGCGLVVAGVSWFWLGIRMLTPVEGSE